MTTSLTTHAQPSLIDKLFFLLAAQLIPLSGDATSFAYIPNLGDNTIAVINTNTDTIVRKYKNLTAYKSGSFGVAITPSHQNVFISHPAYRPAIGESDLVTLLQPKARQAKPLNVTVEKGAYGITTSPSGWTVYQANASSGSISVLSAAGALHTNLNLKLNWPLGIAATNSNNKTLLYVTENNSNSVAVIDPVYGAILKRIQVGKSPVGIVVSPDSSRAYVANFGDGTLSAIDTATLSVIQTIPIEGNPYSVALSPDGNTILAVYQRFTDRQQPKRGGVSFIDKTSLSESYNVQVGKTPVGISTVATAKGYKAYVVNQGSNTTSVIRVNNGKPKIVKTLSTGNKPTAYGSFIMNNSGLSFRYTEGLSGLIADFATDTLQEWGSSEVMELLGIDPTPASQQSVNEILSQLQGISSSLNTMESQLQSLMQGFYNLEAQMAQQGYQQQAEFLNHIETGAATNFTQFQNSFLAAGESNTYLTLEQLIASPQNLNLLATLLTDEYLNSLAVAAQQMSNTQSGQDQVLSQTIPDYLLSAQTYLKAQIAQLVQNNSNIMAVGTWTPPNQQTPVALSVFDQYNNALINQYLILLTALQEIYTIEATTLYLQANLPDQFGDIVLAEPGIGITTLENYTQNLATLNNLFTQRTDQLYNLFSQAIVSDAGGSNVNPPTKTGSMVKIAGTWNQNTNLYVWQGLLAAGEPGYTGVWDGNNLTVQYQGQTPYGQYSINIGEVCAQPDISFWYLNGWNGQLQCPPQPVPMASPSPYQWVLATYFGFYDPDATLYFDFNDTTNNTQWTLISQSEHDASDLIQVSPPPVVYSIETAKTIYNDDGPLAGYFSGNVGITAANGFIGQYIIYGIADVDYLVQINWSITLNCPSTAINNCYDTYAGICLGGNMINMLGLIDNNNTATIYYAGSCPPPQ